MPRIARFSALVVLDGDDGITMPLAPPQAMDAFDSVEFTNLPLGPGAFICKLDYSDDNTFNVVGYKEIEFDIIWRQVENFDDAEFDGEHVSCHLCKWVCIAYNSATAHMELKHHRAGDLMGERMCPGEKATVVPGETTFWDLMQ